MKKKINLNFMLVIVFSVFLTVFLTTIVSYQLFKKEVFSDLSSFVEIMDDTDLVRQMEEIERDSAQNTKRLNIAMNYGGRAEIVHAVNQLIEKGYKKITEEDIANQLYTLDAPMPDFIVRTGGEQRISNFLMWQSAA